MTKRANFRHEIDERLTAEGHHPLTPWWRDQLARFDAHRTARTLVARVGRGGIKSTTAVRWAVGELLSREWSVPPGEIHYLAFVSISVGEAGQRLGQASAVLSALGVEHRRLKDEIHLTDVPLGLKVFSATVGAVSGFRCIGFVADELAKWRYSDSSANPAREVISSLRAMCVTHPDARALLVSSPWSEADHHTELVQKGDTDSQLVCQAPTWVANPTITEAETRDLESDPRVWAREYMAVPMSSSSPAFETLDEVVNSGVTDRQYSAACTYGVTFDLGGHKSGFGAAVFHFELQQAQNGQEVHRRLIFDKVVSLTPTFLRRVTFQRQVEAVQDLCREYRVTAALCDQHQYDAVQEALKQRGVATRKADMSAGTQATRSSRYIGRMRNGSLRLLDHKELLDQHRAAVSVERASGFIIKSPGRGARDDLLDCCLLAVDESFDHLPAQGSEIKYQRARLAVHNGLPQVVSPGRYYREGADGSCVPVAMPKSDRHYLKARRERWIRGVFTPEDINEFGDDLMARVHEELNR